jgi:NAD+ kinase
MTLAGRRAGEEYTYAALNDIVLAKSGTAKVISIDAYVDDEFLASFLADGIIISTPTGSTAYSLATGGPVVVPSSNVIVISPISAHTLTARPVIVEGDSVITLCASTEEGSVMAMADGVAILQDQTSIEMEISRGSHNVVLVKGLGPKYFETLRAKLSWAHDHRFGAEASIPRLIK